MARKKIGDLSAVATALLHSAFFANMDEMEYFTVIALMELRHLKKGTLVFTQGDPGNELFICLSGSLSAYLNTEGGPLRRMFILKPGDFFGEMSVIARKRRFHTLIAEEDSEVMAFRDVDFFRILDQYPRIGIKILRSIGRLQRDQLDQSARHLGDIMRWGESARRRAIIDDLTGLYNRRFLEDTIKDRFLQGAVGLRRMALLMMDLDKVHDINDRYGTLTGDRVIISVADVIRSSIRGGDIPARLSGDEFAVLLLDTGGADALNIAERMRETISLQEVSTPNPQGAAHAVIIRPRTSIGIAEAPAQADSMEHLIDTADKALRRAKELGRNRVELAV